MPEALASIAGVSLVVGLYAARPALVHYAVFGSSRQGRHCVASVDARVLVAPQPS